MERLIAHYGRPRIWATLAAASLLFLIIALRTVSVSEEGPGPIPPGLVMATGDQIIEEDPKPIDPAEALATGGHIVKVFVFCGSEDQKFETPVYEVVTHSGRPPEQHTGQLSGNMAQIVVGNDWIGQVRFETWRTTSEITDLIGSPFGWQERRVEFGSCH